MAGRKDRFDWITFVIYFTLIVIGWLMQYAVNGGGGDAGIWEGNFGRHTVWVGISLVAFIVAQIIDARLWRTLAYPIYGVSIILLVLVLLVGEEINNARSWFILGGMSFQPGEFAKLGTTLVLCAYLTSFQTRLKTLISQATAMGLILLPALLVLLQPDAGSALVFFSFLILFFREGMPIPYYVVSIYVAVAMLTALVFPVGAVATVLSLTILMFFAYNLLNFRIWLLLLGSVLTLFAVHLFYDPVEGAIWMGVVSGMVILAMYIAWTGRQQRALVVIPVLILLGVGMASLSNFVFEKVLQPHQQDRIQAWLQPDQGDPQGSLYNIIQSKVAIGSGGLAGKGFLEGSMTQLNYVPEQATDFIFSTIGEEQGFIGSLSVIFLFLALILRIVYIGETRENHFIRIYAYGLAGVIFTHFFVNIGMTMGLVPVVGIPLPFISKGGSALVVFSLMISILLRLSKSRM